MRRPRRWLVDAFPGSCKPALNECVSFALGKWGVSDLYRELCLPSVSLCRVSVVANVPWDTVDRRDVAVRCGHRPGCLGRCPDLPSPCHSLWQSAGVNTSYRPCVAGFPVYGRL